MITIYRVKDNETGKYFSSSRYSYSKLSFNKRGRIFTGLSYIKNSFNLKKADIYIQLHREDFPLLSTADWYNYFEHRSKLDEEREKLRNVTVWFPDTWIVVDGNDEEICTLNKLME